MNREHTVEEAVDWCAAIVPLFEAANIPIIRLGLNPTEDLSRGPTTTAVDGEELGLVELIEKLNTVVGSYGWGRIDMVENRRVGIKSRETYECPAALALIMAHTDLESITLERDLAREKSRLEPRYAELIYDGLWFSPLRAAFDAFVEESQHLVTGDVRLRLSPGQCEVTGRRSPHSLYDYGLATYDAEDSFNHEDSAGFVRLWGLGLETWAAKRLEQKAELP